MSISKVNSAASASVPKIQSAQAADGDRKVHGTNTAKTKDADGDYKLIRGSLALSSGGVQAALTKLKTGG